jgi:hypothetical protein
MAFDGYAARAFNGGAHETPQACPNARHDRMPTECNGYLTCLPNSATPAHRQRGCRRKRHAPAARSNAERLRTGGDRDHQRGYAGSTAWPYRRRANATAPEVHRPHRRPQVVGMGTTRAAVRRPEADTRGAATTTRASTYQARGRGLTLSTRRSSSSFNTRRLTCWATASATKQQRGDERTGAPQPLIIASCCDNEVTSPPITALRHLPRERRDPAITDTWFASLLRLGSSTARSSTTLIAHYAGILTDEASSPAGRPASLTTEIPRL